MAGADYQVCSRMPYQGTNRRSSEYCAPPLPVISTPTQRDLSMFTVEVLVHHNIHQWLHRWVYLYRTRPSAKQIPESVGDVVRNARLVAVRVVKNNASQKRLFVGKLSEIGVASCGKEIQHVLLRVTGHHWNVRQMLFMMEALGNHLRRHSKKFKFRSKKTWRLV